MKVGSRPVATPVAHATTTHLKAAVHKAYGTLHEKDWSSHVRLPAKVRAALEASVKNRAGDDWSGATFAEKTINGQKTYAALVPGVDWQDVTVVDAHGKLLAAGMFDAGDTKASWS